MIASTWNHEKSYQLSSSMVWSSKFMELPEILDKEGWGSGTVGLSIPTQVQQVQAEEKEEVEVKTKD